MFAKRSTLCIFLAVIPALGDLAFPAGSVGAQFRGGGSRGFSGSRSFSYSKSSSWSKPTHDKWNRSGGGLFGSGEKSSSSYTKPSLPGDGNVVVS